MRVLYNTCTKEIRCCSRLFDIERSPNIATFTFLNWKISGNWFNISKGASISVLICDLREGSLPVPMILKDLFNTLRTSATKKCWFSWSKRQWPRFGWIFMIFTKAVIKVGERSFETLVVDNYLGHELHAYGRKSLFLLSLWLTEFVRVSNFAIFEKYHFREFENRFPRQLHKFGRPSIYRLEATI